MKASPTDDFSVSREDIIERRVLLERGSVEVFRMGRDSSTAH